VPRRVIEGACGLSVVESGTGTAVGPRTEVRFRRKPANGSADSRVGCNPNRPAKRGRTVMDRSEEHERMSKAGLDVSRHPSHAFSLT
jgi:hypothetical protein